MISSAKGEKINIYFISHYENLFFTFDDRFGGKFNVIASYLTKILIDFFLCLTDKEKSLERIHSAGAFFINCASFLSNVLSELY